jgi:sRNA-binding carbon storage regulator CsrA
MIRRIKSGQGQRIEIGTDVVVEIKRVKEGQIEVAIFAPDSEKVKFLPVMWDGKGQNHGY